VLRRIVRNPVNKGQWTYGKTRAVKSNGKTRQVKGNPAQQIVVAVPAIVSEEEWQEAQTRLQMNKLNARRNAKHDFLLQGLIVCACGRRWGGSYASHLKRAYYRCRSWTEPKWIAAECQVQGGVRQERLEEAVWEKVCTTLLDETYLRIEMAQRKDTVAAELIDKKRRLDAIETAIADIDRKQDMLLDQLLSGRFAVSKIEKRQAQLAAQQQELETDAVRLRSEIDRATLTPEQEETVLAYARRVREGTEGLGFSDKRRILELLSVKVEVIDQEHFRITAMLPLNDADVTVQRPPRSKARTAIRKAVQVENNSSTTVQFVEPSAALERQRK
jgi:site-specific DNA recombinase